jgi:3-mercaptopyruvate sulfurtransferase SseA
VALLLKRRGISRVRPLAGGLAAWREHGYPIEPASAADPPSAAPSLSPGNVEGLRRA